MGEVELRRDDCMEAGGSECRDEYMDIFGRKCLEQIFQHILKQQPRVESVTETEKMSGTYFPDKVEDVNELL